MTIYKSDCECGEEIERIDGEPAAVKAAIKLLNDAGFACVLSYRNYLGGDWEAVFSNPLVPDDELSDDAIRSMACKVGCNLMHLSKAQRVEGRICG